MHSPITDAPEMPKSETFFDETEVHRGGASFRSATARRVYFPRNVPCHNICPQPVQHSFTPVLFFPDEKYFTIERHLNPQNDRVPQLPTEPAPAHPRNLEQPPPISTRTVRRRWTTTALTSVSFAIKTHQHHDTLGKGHHSGLPLLVGAITSACNHQFPYCSFSAVVTAAGIHCSPPLGADFVPYVPSTVGCVCTALAMSRSIDEGIVVLMCVQPLLDSCPAFATRAGHVPVELFFRVVRLNAILAWKNDDGDINNSHLAGVLLDTGCVYMANKTEYPQKKPSLQSLALRIQRTHGIDPTATWLMGEAREAQFHAPVAAVRSVTTLRADDTAYMTVEGVSSTLLDSTEEFAVQPNPDATIKRVLSSVALCVERHMRAMGNVQITALTRYSRLQQTSAVMKWLKTHYWSLASKFDVSAVEDTLAGVTVRNFDPAPHVCPVHRVLARRHANSDGDVTFCCMRGEVCAIHAAIGVHNEEVQRQARRINGTVVCPVLDYNGLFLDMTHHDSGAAGSAIPSLFMDKMTDARDEWMVNTVAPYTGVQNPFVSPYATPNGIPHNSPFGHPPLVAPSPLQKMRSSSSSPHTPPLAVPRYEIPGGCRMINGDIVMVDSDEDEDFPHCF